LNTTHLDLCTSPNITLFRFVVYCIYMATPLVMPHVYCPHTHTAQQGEF